MKTNLIYLFIFLLNSNNLLHAETLKLKHSPNPIIKELNAGEFKLINSGHKGDKNVLAFSGLVYDHKRHTLLAFGGGHATGLFPNSVHSFNLTTLTWKQLTPDVPPIEYSDKNAVMTKDGKKLGGVIFKGKPSPGSRHTYDGLTMSVDGSVMICAQAQEFIGAARSMPKPNGKKAGFYRDFYKGGNGLWLFDPDTSTWKVSTPAGLAAGYCLSESTPKQPDWIYIIGHKNVFHKVNIKTFEKRKIKSIHGVQGTPSMTYNPLDESFLVFPCGSRQKNITKIFRYDIQKETWTTIPAAGESPNTYNINVVYDSAQKVFCCFNNGYFFYWNPIEKMWYKHDKLLEESFTAKRMGHHHIYDPINNAHLLVTGRWNTYAFKFPTAK
ncbi:MAG: hypothetical protein COA79_06880 [Planctomycetota bacterium]|nr:MAG: hypothetical protein COA79_06880 [Planctomycetota bacterium]